MVAALRMTTAAGMVAAAVIITVLAHARMTVAAAVAVITAPPWSPSPSSSR